MQLWADVYDADGNSKIGKTPITELISASITRTLDGAGSMEVVVPASATNLDALINERQLWIYAQSDDESPRLIGTGYIRKRRIVAGTSGTQMSISGPDLMDALRRKSVLLGRIFDTQAVGTIASDLIGLVGDGWQVNVDTSLSADTQTVRFDGSTVLKALIRVAEEKGAHIRSGLQPKTVELGAFGTPTDLVAIEPPSTVSMEMYANDNVLLIDRITQLDASDDVVNWIIPIGAGEGVAAQTLAQSTRTSPYPIQTMTGPDGRTLYYISDASSVERYGAIQRVVTFKEIGPIANSTTAQTLAANALYDAAAAWLQRSSDKTTTYQITARKCRRVIRPGDKIRLIWRGTVETSEGDVVPIDVDDYFWVMQVTETVTADGMGVSLQIASVDRAQQDPAKMIVGALESIHVNNVSVQTFPYWSSDTYTDYVCYLSSTGVGRYATFKLEFDNNITNIISVKLRFKSRPLIALSRMTAVAPTAGTNFDCVFDVVEGDEHPKGLHLYVNGIDVSINYGGPWNPTAGDNNPINVECDITQLILDAGIYNDHVIQFRAQVDDRPSAYQLPGFSGPGLILGQRSSGLIEANFRVFGTSRAIVPS